MTEIDGLDIHFIHVRSVHQDALPLQQARPRGHFAAWEQPDLFVAAMRDAFRTLR